MVSTIELQVSAARFTNALLQTLRQTPRPLPDPTFGFQVQRIRYLGASLRHDKDVSYQIFHVNGGHDVGLGYEWITGKQAQLAVAIAVEVVTDASIQAHVNRVAPADVVLNGTLVFNLDASQGTKIGSLQLVAALDDLETGADFPSLPGYDDAKAWAIDQLSKQLSLKPMTFDLSYAVPPGRQFENVGLAVGSTGDFLMVRAEVTGLGNVARWTNFHRGLVDNGLGGADWAVVVLPADLVLTLQTTLWGGLSKALGYGLITVGVEYTGHGNSATFRITPYVQTFGAMGVIVGTVSPTIPVTVSLEDGAVVLDIDGSQADEIGSGIQAVIAGMAVLFVPMVGWLMAALLYELIGEALDQLSAAVADLAEGFEGLPPGTTVEEIDPDRFVYRVRIPFKTPAGINGRVTGLSAGADTLALRGSWVTSGSTEGDLQVDVSRFAWIAPKVGCGASADAALHAFDADPTGSSASLHAQVELSTSGTAPVSVDGVVIRQMSSQVGSALRFDRGGPRLPTTLNLDAPGYLSTSGQFSEPIVIDVRTSLGVVRCHFDPPTPPTEAEIRLMRSAIKVQLQVCDARAMPTWWLGKHGFIVDWVDHGLEDPDHIDVRTGIRVVVTSGIPGLVLGLEQAGQTLTESTLDEQGFAVVEHVLVPGEAPTARLRVPSGIEDTEAYAAAAAQVEAGIRPPESSFAVYRTQFVSLGRTHLASADRVVAAEREGVGRFLVRSGDEEVLVQARPGMARPSVEDSWLVARAAEFGSGDVVSRSASGRLGNIEAVLGNGSLRDRTQQGSYGASAWLSEGVWSGDVVARATGHGVEFWHRTGDPVLVPPPGPEGGGQG